jgi:hypothetical protein
VGRDAAEQISSTETCRIRQASIAVAEQGLQVCRDGERLLGVELEVSLLQRAGDLEREQCVATRGLVDAAEQGPRKDQVDAVPEHASDRPRLIGLTSTRCT